jgi:hypothetical protein
MKQNGRSDREKAKRLELKICPWKIREVFHDIDKDKERVGCGEGNGRKLGSRRLA